MENIFSRSGSGSSGNAKPTPSKPSLIRHSQPSSICRTVSATHFHKIIIIIIKLNNVILFKTFIIKVNFIQYRIQVTLPPFRFCQLQLALPACPAEVCVTFSLSLSPYISVYYLRNGLAFLLFFDIVRFWFLFFRWQGCLSYANF